MKYLYTKKISINDIKIIELNDRFIIKNIKNNIELYGIIILIKDYEIVKDYNNYKIIINNDNEVKLYDDLLSDNIRDYKKFINNNEINIISSDKIKKYFKEKVKDLYLNIHYVKKTGFLNIPKISIL